MEIRSLNTHTHIHTYTHTHIHTYTHTHIHTYTHTHIHTYTHTHTHTLSLSLAHSVPLSLTNVQSKICPLVKASMGTMSKHLTSRLETCRHGAKAIKLFLPSLTCRQNKLERFQLNTILVKYLLIRLKVSSLRHLQTLNSAENTFQ